MVNGECNCIVCGNINNYSINTNIKGYKLNDYLLTNKNNDGTYDCEISIKCGYCGANYKTKQKIKFIPDVILEEEYNEASVYDFISQ